MRKIFVRKLKETIHSAFLPVKTITARANQITPGKMNHTNFRPIPTQRGNLNFSQDLLFHRSDSLSILH